MKTHPYAEMTGRNEFAIHGLTQKALQHILNILDKSSPPVGTGQGLAILQGSIKEALQLQCGYCKKSKNHTLYKYCCDEQRKEVESALYRATQFSRQLQRLK